ncbi:MAG: FHA domain-containing protein [Deltaproteobacteria bacterium]|nr:FHA domain-containing protein [Deltaproteobacteria bacterium]
MPEEGYDDDDDVDPPPAARPAEKRGLFARLFGKPPPPTPPEYFVVDPVREILAIPRGAARLDAFEQKLRQLVVGSPEHKKVALGFHRELTSLATDAGVDLGLFETRVTACARALIEAGEDERAGTLFAKIGRRHQAAELFVKAGAIDALEEAHAELSFAEGGPKLDARLSFERFEALFLVGLRDDALLALKQAVKLWDNPVYAEVLQGFLGRLPPSRRLTLQAGEDVVRVFGRFPLVLGRGEESAVRIDSPLVSRAHVQIERATNDALMIKDMVSSGGTKVSGVVIHGAGLLPAQGQIDLAGVVVEVDRSDQRLLLRPHARPRQVTLAPFTEELDDDVVGFRLTLRDDRVRVAVDARVRLNGEVIRRETLLLGGDRLVAGGRTFSVVVVG